MIAVERVRHNLSILGMGLALATVAGALVLLPLTSAIAVVGGAILLIAILRWPELALYLLIVAVPFGSWFPIPVSVGNLTAVDLCVALLLALWLARMMVQARRIVIQWPPLSAPFALFLAAALVSTTGALSLQYSAKELAKWIEMFAIYVFVANELDATKATRTLTALFLVGAAEAAIGVYQFLFRVGPEGFALLGRFMRAYGTFEQPNPFAGYLALSVPIALGVVIGFIREAAGAVGAEHSDSDGPSERSEESPNDARFFAPLSRIEQTTGDWTSEGVQKQVKNQAFISVLLSVLRRGGLPLLALLSLGAMLAGLLMSWSRGAWLGAAAALVIVVVVQSRRALVLTVALALVLVFIVLLSSLNVIPEAIAARFSGIGDYVTVFDVRGVKVDDANFAVVERMAHWQAAWEMFFDHPWLGVGFGNYAVMYPVYALPRWSDPLGHAHNYYLNVAAEAGLVGLGAYLLLWAAVFWQGWVCVRNAKVRSKLETVGVKRLAATALRLPPPAYRGLAAGLLGMVVALSLHNGFDNLFVHGMHVQVGIGLGTVAWLNRPV